MRSLLKAYPMGALAEVREEYFSLPLDGSPARRVTKCWTMQQVATMERYPQVSRLLRAVVLFRLISYCIARAQVYNLMQRVWEEEAMQLLRQKGGWKRRHRIA